MILAYDIGMGIYKLRQKQWLNSVVTGSPFSISCNIYKDSETACYLHVIRIWHSWHKHPVHVIFDIQENDVRDNTSIEIDHRTYLSNLVQEWIEENKILYT